MSKLIATINGKDIYSDKQMVSIEDSRVTFSDGSWCDVETGQVSNSGPGFINIGTPNQTNTKPFTFGPKTYKADSLILSGIDANVNIQPHNDPFIEVLIEGAEADVNAIHITHSGNSLHLNSDKNPIAGSGIRVRGSVVSMGNYQSGGISIGQVIGRGRAIVAGGNIVIGGSTSSSTKITIKVPDRTSISLSGIMGNVTIGDTNGLLQVVSTASGDVQAGKVSSVSLKIQGSGNVSIAEVNGSADISIMGSGDVSIKGGGISMLSASVMGSGDVSFSGLADNAVLTVMGSGDIWVKNVKNRPITSVLGSGDIKVLNW